ncbi:MAG: DoxX family protein [Flavobacteriaceae bacterium]
MISEYLAILIKAGIFITIINVWLLRFNKPTPFRGGSAKSMKEEFEVYGISSTAMYAIGIVKIILASGILASIWFPDLTTWACAGLGIFMLGAIVMHFKANDPSIRSLPALTLLVGCILIISLETFI